MDLNLNLKMHMSSHRNPVRPIVPNPVGAVDFLSEIVVGACFEAYHIISHVGGFGVINRPSFSNLGLFWVYTG